MKIAYIIISLLLLQGCSTMGDILAYDPDSYTRFKQNHVPAYVIRGDRVYPR